MVCRKESDWEFADIYAHELHEVTEKLIDGKVIYDDYNISELAENMVSLPLLMTEL